MATHAARSQEDGQVLPALLLAVLVAGLLTTTLFIVGRSGDQSARAGTASDAAALAAGKQAGEELRGWIVNDHFHLDDLAGSGNAFGTYLAKADTYADANGARVVAPSGFLSRSGPLEWTFEVTVEAKDTVSDAKVTAAKARSTSRVALTLQRLCPRGNAFGLVVQGRCLTAQLWDDLCSPAPPPVTPSPSPSATGTATPEPEPEPDPDLAGLTCPGSGYFFDSFKPQVRLIS